MARSPCFRRDPSGALLPTPRAGSGWGADHMRGLAVSGALARAAEAAAIEVGRDDLRPVRWTLDLFRAAKMVPTTTRTRVVHSSRRLLLVDAELLQAGRAVARAGTLFLRPDPAAAPSGIAPHWPTVVPPTTDGQDHPDDVERMYQTPGGPWVPGRPPTDREPLNLWHFEIPIVEGEEPTAFQNTAAISDVVNATTNVGPQGLAFINPDVSLLLARPVVGPSVGLASVGRVEGDGLAVSTATVFDRHGPCGTVSTSALSQPPIELVGSPLLWLGHTKDSR
ncbi:acyl-CoA thioesterase domain-containing protein [Gordonia sp. (in: high G+C Gram-positive bacteria)]|uniref:acyl-CoA thioesterase domain-containing protein n=1 Tax=Gordonia sp. (in: high G+C Gram-positive bacteria) TaxID=84139 RepID=UPI0039E37760